MFLVRIKRPKTKAQKRNRIVALAALIVLILSGSTVAVVAAASKIVTTTVEFDGRSVTVSSFSENPYEIAAKAGVQLNSGDELELEKFDADSPENLISVSRAYDVTVTDGTNSAVTVRCCGTVSDALEKANITLNETDNLNFSPNVPLYESMPIIITRSFKVVVTADGKSKKYSVSKCTVGDLLKKAGISLSEDDIVNYDTTQAVFPGMEIRVERVTYKTIKETKTLDFTTEEQNTDELYVGQTQVAREGEKGHQTNYYSCKYVDGKLTEKKLVIAEITKTPVSKIILHGTKTYPAVSSGVISELTPNQPIELDANGRPVNYKKLIVGQATAYSIGSTTATGQKTMPGRIAVNPKQIPYGTKMYIVSSDGKYVYGYCEASDTGGFVYNSSTIADLYFNTEAECIRFGRRNVEIYILE